MILRTEAEERSESELKRDVEAMTALWKGINEQFRLVPAPHELHRDLGLVGRVARDQLTEYVDELLIDSESDYARVIELLQKDAPHLANKVSLYAGDIPIFEQYELESEIAKALSKAIPLPHGGQVTVDETEALTSIDVDTGKYVGKTNLADTILRTNLEAVEEVARQLRLRDIGGIIVIDFIDMDRVRDRIRVMNELE
ncbi:MAG: ribonuclease G, partial [Armatimonadetes bacterium CG_4_9_14_3_um_filter_58_7]